MSCWAGVDVGGRRKGFHVAVIDDRGVVAGPLRHLGVEETVDGLLRLGPVLAAVDSPVFPAPTGRRSRDGERRLAREICGIRFTPDQRALEANPTYYGWILNGLELYRELAAAGLHAIECFPTASFTRWVGRRGRASRARWTRRALPRLGLDGVPARTNQDERDAIAAALTARACSRGLTEAFGEIVVPRGGSDLA